MKQDQNDRTIAQQAAEAFKEAWVTPEMSDYEVEALTTVGGGADIDGPTYS